MVINIYFEYRFFDIFAHQPLPIHSPFSHKIDRTSLNGLYYISYQGLVNVLIVEPDSILPLVNGSLRMPHSEAIKYVRLRQDFDTARIEGRSLQQLLTEGGAVADGKR